MESQKIYMKKLIVVLCCLFLISFASPGPIPFGVGYNATETTRAPLDHPAEVGDVSEIGGASPEDNSNAVVENSNRCSDCCSNDDLFLKLTKRVSLLEKEISKLRLELEKNKVYGDELDTEPESQIEVKEERKGITGFFAKIFGK